MSELYTIYKREYIADPDRSRPRLLPLEPIGLGTGDVESLTSYLMRLASAHWVSPTRLYQDLVQKRYGGNVRKLKSTAGLDSRGNAATWLSNALAVHSPLPVDFSKLTCLPLSDIVSKRQQGVMASTMRWCVLCYADMQKHGRPLHNKLLWSLKPIDACPAHEIHLSTTCSNCGRRPDFNRSNSIVGRCSNCGSDLSEQEPGRPISLGTREALLWKSRAIRDFIGANWSDPPRQIDLRRSLETVIESIGQGSRTRLAKELNLSRYLVLDWTKQNKRPNLVAFVEFCYRLDIPPARFFDQTEMLITGPLRVRPNFSCQRRTPMSDKKYKRVKSQLRALIDGEADLGTLNDVATRLGISERMLADRYPEENATIARRGRARRAREKVERDAARCERVEIWANELAAREVYPSERQIKKGCGILPSDLRVPKVKAVLRKIQRRCKAHGVQSQRSKPATAT